MKKITLVLAVLIALCAFDLPENDSFPKQVFQKFLSMLQQRPQEKVYLHTDRDHYDVGDKVWFRAYLTNGYNHKESAMSRFVYVELLDRQDSLRARIKIPLRDSIFSGYMPLDTKLQQGDYFLRAYSYWMQNAGDEFIFRKKIRVINPRNAKVQTEISYENTAKGSFARIRFHNTRKEAYDKVWVDYVLDGKSKVARADDNGVIEVKLDSVNFGKKMLVRFKDEEPFEYEGYLYLPDPRTDFEVSFMPEGGDLLEGCQQTIAFKAIGCDGLSREVSGLILNDKEEQVAFIQTLHKGMGAFEFKTVPGERYYALLSMADGNKKRFDLPVPKSDGIALKLLSSTEVLGYVVLAADSTQESDDLYLVAHSRGVPLICQPVTIGTKGKLLVKDLPEGILHVLIMNSKGEVYSQRLCFIRKSQRPEIMIQSDKDTYYVRDQVHLDLQILADSLQMKKGSFSMAVTDDSQIERDSLQGNILSSLLLTSDLKGYVEEPGWYFKDNRVTTRRILDLLMMTQGWTRFDVSRMIRNEYDTLKYYMERGQAVSGQVKNFWGKDAINANLILLSTSGIFQIVNADSSGYFMIDGIAFPDSTKFVLQGKSKKGRRGVEVAVDRDEYLTPYVKIPFNRNQVSEEDDFYKKFTKDYFYDNGIKVYVLDEAVVKRKMTKSSYSFYDQMADYNLDSAKLASMGDWDIRRVLEELPGIEAWGDSVNRFGKRIHLLVNDFEEDFDYVLLLQPRDLVSISYIRPPMSATLFGEAASNGAIVITTNPNFVPRDRPKPNMVTFSLLGYQKKAEFYMPHYEVDSIRQALTDTTDRRRTIYWNPNIATDEAGRAKCFFNTSDSYGPYTIIIEGILNDGTVCRKEQKLRLKL